ncbi:MAG: SpoIIE family protein phosphatase [Oscillospiraceae bacterium]|nr:SpoIIE family protein phosphatase [Oscillospiraceae bacterium]
MLNGITLFRLITASLLPMLLAIGFYQAEKKSRFKELSNLWKQAIIGVSFGVVAILATEFGIPVDGAVLNVRNAAPLTAGLIFGWPSGLIAGFVGGVERWFTPAGDYTRVACSVGTIVAGIFGAGVRRFMMDNKKASWFYGLAVGVTSEVLHMLLVFLTNADDIHRAFSIVKICAIPMIAANGVSVMLSILAITFLVKRSAQHEHDNSRKENIAQTFQRWLLVCVVLAFVVTTFFTQAFQNQIAYATVDYTLKANIDDVCNDIRDVSNRNLMNITKAIAAELPENATHEELLALAQEYDVTDINVVDRNGIIAVSSNPEYVGFNMASGAQSVEFMGLLYGTDDFVQDYRPITHDSNVYRKYAGVALENGFLQVGYDTAAFYDQIREQVKYAAENRHIGQEGFIIICDENGMIVSDREGHQGENVSIFGDTGGMNIQPGERVAGEIYGTPSFVMYTECEGYYIIAVMSKEEALFSKSASVYMLAFMETLVFAALFANIFVLIKKLVVKNIRKINESLAQITEGNLNVTVDVRDNEEFASLSDDINSTVATLKSYIDEAAARFDKDLEIAKKIQHSALPSVFPPYPTRKDFSIFASMDAAKEVGGDFYDFYLLDENHLAFVVADVSGKGIPGAMFMMTSKTLIKSHAESGLAVNEVFTQVNAQLCENNEAGMFVTAWMGVLDLETGLIRYANAGHNPPVVRHKDGSYEYLKGRANFVLAGMEGVRYKEQQLQLQQGDEIYLYTDGVTEAHNIDKQLFGEDRLLASLNETHGMTVEEICRKVKADVDAFQGEAEQFDDITMLCVRLSEVENKMLSVNPTMETVQQVAAFVEEHLEAFEVPMKLSAKLMVSVDEIYSNIVRYSGATEAQVRILKEDDTLRLIFRDNGKPYNPLDAKEPDITASAEDRAIGGLGIFMVRKMMDDVEYEYTGGMNKLTLTIKVQ